VEGVGGRGDEIEMLVEASGVVVFGVNREGADAGDVGGLQGALHGIAQERFANALALPAAIDGQAREQHDGHGMFGQAFGQAFRGFL
jgi:hypothetical protein